MYLHKVVFLSKNTKDDLPSFERLASDGEIHTHQNIIRTLLLPKLFRRNNMPKDGESRSLGKQSILSAMLPGAQYDNKQGKVTVNIAISNEIVRFNIGGTKFETYRNTLHRLPNSPLANEDFLQKHYREKHKDYFFDRDPDVFKAIMNYLRTGELHLPSWACGAAVKHELNYWGVQEDEIEACCWNSYSSWLSTLEALRELEKNRKAAVGDTSQSDERREGKWAAIQINMWKMFNSPKSSLAAKVIKNTVFILIDTERTCRYVCLLCYNCY